MTYCQECGSEVAEIDTFCPFCGISLKPLPVAENASEDAFASTIAMPELATAKPPDAAAQAADGRSKISPEPVALKTEKITGDANADAAGEAEINEPAVPENEIEVMPADASGPADSIRDIDVVTEPADGPVPPTDSALSFAVAPAAASEKDADVSESAAAGPAELPIDLPPEPPDAIIAEEPEAVVIEEIDLKGNDATESLDEIEDDLDLSYMDLSPAPFASKDVGSPQSAAGTTGPPEVAEDDALVNERPADDLPDAGFAELRETGSGPTSSGSGDLPSESANSFTTPNFGGTGTDGRKSGLKPLGEGTLLAGRYKITRKIGGGGMGAVYLATDLNLGNTQRAVKEMVQSHIEEEQQAKAIDDFKRESMILSTLDHPSIPTIYDYFYDEAESRFYLVMKYISGGDLASRLRSAPEGRIDERTVTEWALQIIDVLDYLHSLPTTIVYRDLKPSNVMIDGNTGRIMLIDFGIARSINQNQEKGVTAVGTMGYAPPELFSGQVEPRSDIYSLGSTMFHLLTGADPQNNPLLIFDFQKNPRPRQINPRLSDQIEKILMRAVEYSADARFSSAADMKRALQEHLDNLRSGNVTYGTSESPAAVSLAFQSVFCGFCGQRIVATDLFCAFCGSKQPIAQHGVHSEIYARGNITARLVIDGTSELESPAFSLEKSENLVGRRDPMSNIFPEVDLSKYDPQTKISRRHARIWRDGAAYLVEDLGSSNGTLLVTKVSDTLRLVPHQPHPLSSGDRLRIGDTTLHFIVG